MKAKVWFKPLAHKEQAANMARKRYRTRGGRARL